MQLDILSDKLSRIYELFGYQAYAMSKFEEYELYLRNKEFLVSDRILTFTDTDGRLMALKPYVTLSIIKNTSDCASGVQKLYYHEHVYRPGKNDQGFREIMQIGLECMGRVDTYCVLEVLQLAVKSLQAISEHCVLDISHMGLVSELLDAAGLTDADRRGALEAIGNKNAHELSRICAQAGVESDRLVKLIKLSGKASSVAPQLQVCFGDTPAVRQLCDLAAALEKTGIDCVNIDFSVVNDMNYYNGIVFVGFVQGVPEAVLSGGQYDALMRKMKRADKAVGFAVYPALLELLQKPRIQPQSDVLYYEENTPLDKITEALAALRGEGKQVSAQPGPAPAGAVGYELIGNEVRVIENDA